MRRRGPRPGIRFRPELKTARVAAGKTKADVARAADIDPAFYHRLEEGRSGCNERIARSIARYVGSSLAVLRLTDSDDGTHAQEEGRSHAEDSDICHA